MSWQSEVDPRYPIGRFQKPEEITTAMLGEGIRLLRALPEEIQTATRGLSELQMEASYREGGWSVRQVVHHVADSHMTMLHRVKRTLTEEEPGVPGYDEARFAEGADYGGPVEWSLALLKGLHGRMGMLLESLTAAEWERRMNHAENGPMRLDEVALLYAWHGRHHTAQITELRRRRGW